MIKVLLPLFLSGALGLSPGDTEPKRDPQRPKVESRAFAHMLSTLLSHSVPEVQVREIPEDTRAFFLDARAKREFEISHLKNALWVGYDDFDAARVVHIPKDRQIIVYCSVGYRSEKIAEQLIDAGFTSVANLYGGLFEWKNEGRPVFNQAGPTQNVHAYNRAWGVWLRKGHKVYK